MEDDDYGHYRTAGYGIAGLGGICSAVALVVAALVDVELGFIDARAMMTFSIAMVAIGASMAWYGRAASG